MEYKKYQRITLADLMPVMKAESLKVELLELPQEEREQLMSRFEHYVHAAILARFPDIPKTSLHTRCKRILRREFAFAYLP